jgi:hypothetical protein
MSAESDALLETLRELATKPSYVQGDAGAVTMRSMADMIAAHRYLATVGAGDAVTNARRGLRFSKIIPPGAV